MLNRGEIFDHLTAQNGPLVKALREAGTLDTRLDEALRTAQIVYTDAEPRVGHFGALELALDAIGLPPKRKS